MRHLARPLLQADAPAGPPAFQALKRCICRHSGGGSPRKSFANVERQNLYENLSSSLTENVDAHFERKVVLFSDSCLWAPICVRRCIDEVMAFANTFLEGSEVEASFRSNPSHTLETGFGGGVGAPGGGGGWGGYGGDAEEGKCWLVAKQMLSIPPNERDKEASKHPSATHASPHMGRSASGASGVAFSRPHCPPLRARSAS